MIRAAGLGNARGFEIGDLPGSGGEALVDAGVEELALDIGAVVGAVHVDMRGDDGDGTDDLDFAIGDIELGDGEAAVAGSVELHGLGVDLAGPGDADVIGRQHLVHGGGVAGEGCGFPLIFERHDLLFGELAAGMHAFPLRHERGREEYEAAGGDEEEARHVLIGDSKPERSPSQREMRMRRLSGVHRQGVEGA